MSPGRKRLLGWVIGCLAFIVFIVGAHMLYSWVVEKFYPGWEPASQTEEEEQQQENSRVLQLFE